MAATGFEGFEKRLELHFFGGADPLGLRRLHHDALERVLQAVQCTIVSAVGNRHFDSYVLSESSLFLYPKKIIIKTCGTTQLLKSIPELLNVAVDLDLELKWCKYTRGSFIFPEAQPFPHTSFSDEVMYMEKSLPATLSYRKARVMPSKSTSHSWHVYVASERQLPFLSDPQKSLITLEICMTRLDRALVRQFYQSRVDDGKTNFEAARVMTLGSGIADINPAALVCEYAFDPCGYSMNGLDGDRYSTIHVTPEDGYSYASFECVVSHRDEILEMLQRATAVFRPSSISVSVCTAAAGDEKAVFAAVGEGIKPLGLSCKNRTAEEFPGSGGAVTYQMFTARRK